MNTSKSKKFLIKLANLILEVDESSKDWVNEPNLLRIWYALTSIGGIFALINIAIFISPLYKIMGSSEPLTLGLRILGLSVGLLSSFLIILMSYHYYNYLIKGKSKIFFSNITFFYFVFTITIFVIYYYLLYLSPEFFIVQYNVEISKTVSEITPSTFLLKWDMLLFSALQSVGISYNNIKPNSFLISLLGYFQVIYTYILIALFIASYVNQNNKTGR